jgi:hypothetical protein
MQHIHTTALNSERHNALWQALKYLLLASVVLLAVVELSTGMLIAGSIAAGLVFALAERVKNINARPRSQVVSDRLIGDGGCFPNDKPEMENAPSEPASVLDGGCLEHRRI